MQSTDMIWDDELIQKYSYSGPRYTSYPTALEFDESFQYADLLSAIERSPSRPLSLYVHIPFCHKLCYYCGCNKVVTRHQHKADQYLDYLEREIAFMAPRFAGRTVTQLHWGGGTPTFLTSEQISRLMAALKGNFEFAEDIEQSIEIDPREIELPIIDELYAHGFNRLSFGIQDFDEKVQVAINREQDESFIEALIERARKVGFGSINLDLIYGLPHQTKESFARTLNKVVELDPERLTIFNYAHLPSRFAAQRKLDENAMPQGKDKLDILQSSIEHLTGNGYEFIGMDHFAKPTDELAIAQRNGVLHRNFQGYSTQGEADLLGLGVSSISQIGDCYSQNQKELKVYYKQIDEQSHGQWKGVGLTQDDLIRRKLIKQLLCNFVLEFDSIELPDGQSFQDYFATDLEMLEPLAEDGLVTISDQDIRVEPAGRMLIRNICMCFDTYMRNRARQQQFSRVI